MEKKIYVQMVLKIIEILTDVDDSGFAKLKLTFKSSDKSFASKISLIQRGNTEEWGGKLGWTHNVLQPEPTQRYVSKTKTKATKIDDYDEDEKCECEGEGDHEFEEMESGDFVCKYCGITQG